MLQKLRFQRDGGTEERSRIALFPAIVLSLSSLLLALVTFALSAHHPNIPNERIPFNSDILYPVSLYQDVVVDNNPLSEWAISNSVSFFPDLILSFAILSLAGPQLWLIAYCLLLTLTMTVIISCLFRRLTENGTISLLCLLTILTCLFAVTKDLRYNVMLLYIFIPLFHGGVVIGGMFLLLLYLRTIEDRRIWTPVFAAGIGGLIAFSDKLLISQFLIPFIVVSTIALIFPKARHKPRHVMVILTSVTAILIAVALSYCAQKFDWYYVRTVSLGHANFFESLAALWELLPQLLKTQAHYFVLLVCSCLVSTVSLVSSLRNKNLFVEAKAVGRSYLHLFNLVQVGCVLGAPMCTAAWSGSWWEMRYMLPLYFMPAVVLALFLGDLIPTRDRKVGWLLTGIAIVCGVYAVVRTDFSRLTEPPHEKLVSAMLAIKDKYGLHYGYADHWNTLYFRALSNGELKHNTVRRLPTAWPLNYGLNNLQWFEMDEEGAYPLYDYILTDGIGEIAITKAFGSPAFVEPLPVGKVFIYNREEDTVFRDFLQVPLAHTLAWRKSRYATSGIERSPMPVTDKNAAYPRFFDVSGNPNTDAHSTEGKVGTALAFDGVDDYINCGSAIMNDVLGEGLDWAVAFWWKHPGQLPAGSRRVLQKGDSGKGFQFYQSDANYISANVIFADGSRLDARWDNLIDGAWHHYVLERAGSSLKIWRDGVLAATSVSQSNTGDLSSEDDLMIAARQDGVLCAEGAIDDFRVYDGPVSQLNLHLPGDGAEASGATEGDSDGGPTLLYHLRMDDNAPDSAIAVSD